MPDTTIDAIIKKLWEPSQERPSPQIYAILDCARDKTIFPMVTGADIDTFCLYPASELRYVAPFLVKLNKEDSFTSWLLTNGWGNSWGIFLESDESLRKLRHHFRKFTRVYDEKKKQFFFRFYDPRVLRVYLPTCNAEELKTVYGPVIRYFVEGEEFNRMIEYSFGDGQLMQQTIKINPSA